MNDRPPLAAVPAQAGEERLKRTFAELTQAIYEDPRVGHEARELLLAVAYAVDLAKREDGVSPLRIARRKLGVERGRQARYDRLVADDAPRYEPPEQTNAYSYPAPSCDAPRLRPYQPRPYTPRTPQEPEPTPIRPLPAPIVHVNEGYTPPRDWRTEDGVCGAPTRTSVLEKDPLTGWITAHWFCKRHKDHADRVANQVKVQNEQAPEPIPNTGGLLPCYFNADWEKVYRHYRPQWEPPVYGLFADDWPTPGTEQVVRPQHSRLRLIVGTDLVGTT